MYNTPLTAYRHSCGKIIGGIKSVALIERCKIASFEISADENSYGGVNIQTGEGFAIFRFAEGAARYNEVCRREDGMISVTHSIEFKIDRMDNGSRNLLREMAAASLCGLIAIVTTTQSDSLVVGYSEELLGESPLRLSEAKGTSGKEYTDHCGETVTLMSHDISKARVFTGTV